MKYSGFKNGSLLHTGILDCLVCILHAKNALSALGRGLLVRWLLDFSLGPDFDLYLKNALSALGRGLLVRWLLDLYLACKNV